MDIFASPAVVSLKKGLDAGTMRQRVVANNIANVNTPYFKKSTVVFESLLEQALGRKPVRLLTTDSRHIGRHPVLEELRPQANMIDTTSMRTDGNNVDIDEEMTALAANTIKYHAVTGLLSDNYSNLSLAITGGRR